MPTAQFRLPRASPVLRAGLERIRADFDISLEFPSTVESAAEAAEQHPRADQPERLDARDIPFVTIDPPGSRDLDQAYFAERVAGRLRVRYAIADVAAFVVTGDVVDEEAQARGVTVYLPDSRALLYPAAISEGAASLLPGVERPALLWTIDLDADGTSRSSRLERAIVRSRKALSYAAVQHTIDGGEGSTALGLLREIGEAREAQERARGGVSVAVPTQIVTSGRRGYRLAYDAPLRAEQWNAQISLLAGMCAASIMIEGGVGLLRTLPPPDAQTLDRLRRSASTLGVAWPPGRSYAEVVHDLDPREPRNAAFLTQAVQTLRGAGYALVGGGPPPVHGALAAPYAHVTAPLRRLADRFANEIVLALCAGTRPPAWASEALPALPEIMDRASHRASEVEHAVIDLMESALLASRVGSVLEGVVVDVGRDRATVLVREPPVITRIDAAGRVLGEELEVRVEGADPTVRKVELAAAPRGDGA